jgi:hypothetical protein
VLVDSGSERWSLFVRSALGTRREQGNPWVPPAFWPLSGCSNSAARRIAPISVRRQCSSFRTTRLLRQRRGDGAAAIALASGKPRSSIADATYLELMVDEIYPSTVRDIRAAVVVR